MDENHQDATGSKLIATDSKLWIPPLSTKDQKKLDRLRKKPFAQRMGFAGKTPWDFIQLLLIPLVLLIIGSLFSYQKNQTSLQVSERQHQADLQIAADQQQETTLKTYLDDMSNLLLNNKLLGSQPGDAVRQVARERTLTALRRLDANRNRIVLQFLQDANLIGAENPIIDLGWVDLSGDNLSDAILSDVNLSDAILSDVNLSDAILSSANLSDVNLYNADLGNADLGNADLSYADLSDVNLSGADLIQANLRYVDLRGARITEEQLKEAKSLKGATMPDGSKHP